MDSCLRAFGGKARIIRDSGLNNYIPICDSKTIYVELFCYSAVMFFNINCKNAILNDLNSNIINFWNVIAHKCEEFENELKYIWIAKEWYDELKKRTDDIGRALFFYMDNRQNHAGIIENEWFYKYNVKPFLKDFDLWKRKFDEVAKHSLSIWNLDFRDCLNKLKNKGGDSYKFVIYADPPYVEWGFGYDRMKKEDPNIKYQFYEKDHKDLYDLLSELKDNKNYQIFISYDDNNFIRDLYKDWNIKILDVYYYNKKSKCNELLISNVGFRKYSHFENDQRYQKLDNYFT